MMYETVPMCKWLLFCPLILIKCHFPGFIIPVTSILDLTICIFSHTTVFSTDCFFWAIFQMTWSAKQSLLWELSLRSSYNCKYLTAWLALLNYSITAGRCSGQIIEKTERQEKLRTITSGSNSGFTFPASSRFQSMDLNNGCSWTSLAPLLPSRCGGSFINSCNNNTGSLTV